jgi:hypothetical protein
MAWTGVLQTLLSYQVKTFDGCADWAPREPEVGRACSLSIPFTSWETGEIKSAGGEMPANQEIPPLALTSILIFGAAPEQATEKVDLQVL